MAKHHFCVVSSTERREPNVYRRTPPTIQREPTPKATAHRNRPDRRLESAQARPHRTRRFSAAPSRRRNGTATLPDTRPRGFTRTRCAIAVYNIREHRKSLLRIRIKDPISLLRRYCVGAWHTEADAQLIRSGALCRPRDGAYRFLHGASTNNDVYVLHAGIAK